MSIRIIISDDHKIVRDGLKTLLQKQSEFEVVAELENGRSTVYMATKLLPDVIVMDIAMPDLNGIEATRQIVSSHKDIRIVALSMHSDKRFVSEMLKAGASAYLLKDCAFEELVTAIHTVMDDKIYLSPGIAGVVIDNYIRQTTPAESSAFSRLSDREREVLQLLAEGKTTKEIAAHLFVSIKTVETHRSNIMEKLNIHNIAELTKYAVREGLTSL